MDIRTMEQGFQISAVAEAKNGSSLVVMSKDAMLTPPPAPAKPKSAHPPFKCPMAGKFYRSPAPGAPAFVKVGDKIQKGWVICIIEAMKTNERD